jgi:urea transport system permease protein
MPLPCFLKHRQRIGMKRIGLVAGLLCGMLWTMSSHALTAQQVQDMSIGETDARVLALQKALAQADAQTAVFLQAMADDAVMVAGDKVWMVRDGQALDPVTGQAAALPDSAESLVSNNRMRGEVDSALAALQLLSPDDGLRLKAAQSLVSEPDASKASLLDKAPTRMPRCAWKRPVPWPKAKPPRPSCCSTNN